MLAWCTHIEPRNSIERQTTGIAAKKHMPKANAKCIVEEYNM